MNQRSGLQCVAGPLGMQMARCYAAQLIVDQRHQAIERVLIAVLPQRQEARDLLALAQLRLATLPRGLSMYRARQWRFCRIW